LDAGYGEHESKSRDVAVSYYSYMRTSSMLIEYCRCDSRREPSSRS
jgi:hypothetical protein